MRSLLVAIAITLFGVASAALGQPASGWTTAQDKADMMRQLGIGALVPGPSADAGAPDAANYDEARANPHPQLPDALVTMAGKPVTTAEAWWRVRRPEIVEAFEREVYGRVPANAPRITWTVTATDRERVGPTPVIARRIVGHAGDPALPGLDVDIRMTVVTPANAKGRVPLLIMFGRDEVPAASQPSRLEFERLDAAAKAVLVRQDPALATVFADHPFFTLHAEPPFKLPQRDAHGDLPRPDQLIAAGWGYAMLNTDTIQADDGGGLRGGVIGLANRGGVRRPDDWGVLRAWAWGASRALDHLRTEPGIDPDRIGIEGVSRYGKAALLAMAFDQRFAVALLGSSGKGGVTPLRRNFGEAVASLASGEHYWMAGNFMRYDAVSGPQRRSIADLPVDSNLLLALCAPRLVFVSYGIPEQGDALWLDQRGSYMATVAAGKLFRLLGARDLGVGDDYRVAALPPVNSGLLPGDLAWRQHDGGHTDTPNLAHFLDWANTRFAEVKRGIAPRSAP